MVLKIPQGIKRTLKDKVLGRELKIAEMKHEKSESLRDKRIVYRRSLIGKKEGGKEKDRISAFIVKPYEVAILTQLGKLIGVLSEGIYEIGKEFQYTGTEIIWVDSTEFKTIWGTSDIYLKDNIKIGAHGFLILTVANAKNFVLNLVSNKQIVHKDALDDFIFETVAQSFKDVLGDFDIDTVIRSRSEVKHKVEAELYDILKHWGLELINLEIEGFKLPNEFEELGQIAMENKVEAKKTVKKVEAMQNEIEKLEVKKDLKAKLRDLEEAESQYKRKASILDAKATLEEKKYLSQAQKVEGSVNSEIMEKQKRAEIAGDLAKAQVQGEKEIEIAKITSEKEMRAQERREKAQARREKRERQIKQQIAKLEEKLDKLDDLLAEDKMSEDIYRLRVKRIEKKLDRLEGHL